MSMRRWIEAAGSVDAAEEDRHRDDGERVLARQEGDEDAGEAVAGGERGVGPALDGGNLEVSGEPGTGAGEAQEMTMSRPTGRPCARAARTLPPVIRAAKPKVVRFISTQTTTASTTATAKPQCMSVPGIMPTMFWSPIAGVEGLLGLDGSRSAPSTKKFMIATAM